jgi:hypothetical protein
MNSAADDADARLPYEWSLFFLDAPDLPVYSSSSPARIRRVLYCPKWNLLLETVLRNCKLLSCLEAASGKGIYDVVLS